MADCFPPDYVFGGAVVTYNATVPALSDTTWWGGIATAIIAARWTQAANQVRQAAGSHYSVQAFEANANAGSLFFRLAIGGDMGRLQDVKDTMDGAVKGAGFKLMASAARFISNPRRDGCATPSEGAGKVYPKESGNIDTSASRDKRNSIEVAADEWSKALGLDSLATKLGITSGALLGLSAIAIAGALLVMSRR